MTRLMSFCTRPMVAAKKAVLAPMKVTKDRASIRRMLEQRRGSRDQEDAGGHHGGGVDQGRDRRRAFHRVRQPGVQAELRGLAHGADEQEEGHQRERMHLGAEHHDAVFGELGGAGEDHVELDRVEHQIDAGDAEREADVAHPVDQEGLDRGGAGRRLGVPEADQQIGDQPDALPAEEKLQEVVGGDQRQHEEGETARDRP